MTQAMPGAATDDMSLPNVSSGLMVKVFYAFAALMIVSGAISLAGKWFGSTIAMAGFTDDATVHEIVLGKNIVTAPANMIRFERTRRDGIANRLDLYMRWPKLDGYSLAARDDFNHTSGNKRILFVAFEERMMSRDMSGRFEPIYSSLIVRPGTPGPAGTMTYGFKPASGYLDEVLVVAESAGKEPFVTRCLTGPAGDDSLAPCERDLQVGDNLSLTYRFPRELLANWKALDAAMLAKAHSMLKTTP